MGERQLTEGSTWTGRICFHVDRAYSKEFGTDQRRQRSQMENATDAKRVSWAYLVDSGDESGTGFE